MKRTLKIGIAVLIVGLIMVAAGAFTHSFKDVTFNHHGRPELRTTQTVSKKVKDFDAISVDLKSDQIRIKEGDTARVQVSSTKEAMPTVRSVGHKLVIEQKRADNSMTGWSFGDNPEGTFGLGTFNDAKHPDRTVVVTVPRGTKLNNISIKERQGAIRITDVSSDTVSISAHDDVMLEHMTVTQPLKVNSHDGNLYVTGMTLNTPSIKTDDGAVSLRDVQLNQGSIQLTDGTFNMTNGGFTGAVNVTNDDGDNEIVNADRNKGYILHGDDENKLFEQHNEDGGTLQQNETVPDIMHLTTNDGKNSVQ
ncbi:DUF4097 family beta strand repeat-containing protein [Furfurilactobacillus cerevisiae]|uniref:DUF4097 family beta strand repeat-containing protein n=1 Tax=Furfurilactobacillus rossiae TaxID=231049 RepID=UPI003B97EE38